MDESKYNLDLPQKTVMTVNKKTGAVTDSEATTGESVRKDVQQQNLHKRKKPTKRQIEDIRKLDDRKFNNLDI